MAAFSLHRRVDAPIEVVFRVFTEFDRAAERIPSIESVEMLTAPPFGVGTRWRETRLVKGHRATAEMEVERFEPDEGYVVVCRAEDAVLRAACVLSRDGYGTKVDVALDIEPRTLGARLRLALVRAAIEKEFARDLDGLARAAEAAHLAE